MYTVVTDYRFYLLLPFPPDIAKKSARSAPYTVWGVSHKVLILLAALEFGLATMQLLLQRERGMSWGKNRGKPYAVLRFRQIFSQAASGTS